MKHADERWFLSDCEGHLEIWREAVLRHVSRDESGEIAGYQTPASYRPTDRLAEWDLSTWADGEDADDDERRAIAAAMVREHNERAELLAELDEAREKERHQREIAEAASAHWRIEAAEVERLTAERDRIAEVREAAVREAKRERDAHDQTAAELKRAETERDEARILMERLRNGLATAHENSAHWGRLVSRYYSAWQSARRGRREMRTERDILCAAMELAHSLAAKKGAEVERLRGEIGGLHETVEQADADRDRLTEQVQRAHQELATALLTTDGMLIQCDGIAAAGHRERAHGIKTTVEEIHRIVRRVRTALDGGESRG